MQLHMKHFKNSTLKLFIASLFLVSFYSCSNDDDKGPEIPEETEPVETRLKTGFVISAASPNGVVVKYFEEIPTGTADLTDGQVFGSFFVNDIFDGYIFGDRTLDLTNNISRVQVNLDGEIEQAGSISRITVAGDDRPRVKIANETTGISADNTNPSQVTIFNPTTMEVTGFIDMSTDALPNAQNFFDFIIRGDELFAYLRSATDDNFTSYYVQSANHQTGQFVNTAKFPDVGFNGSRFDSNKSVDEQGNIYFLNNGATTSNIFGRLYKIPAGSNNFDLDYNFNPAQVINPSNIAPIIGGFNYISNDIAIAYAVTETPQAVIDIVIAAGGPQNLTGQQQLQILGLFDTEEVVRWISINVNTQEASIIDGIPAQTGLGIKISTIIDGEVYLEVGTENAIYKFNPTTGVATKAFDVEGGNIVGIIDLSAN